MAYLWNFTSFFHSLHQNTCYFNTKQLTLVKIVKTVISITTDNVTVHIFVFSLSVFFRNFFVLFVCFSLIYFNLLSPKYTDFQIKTFDLTKEHTTLKYISQKAYNILFFFFESSLGICHNRDIFFHR